MSAPPSSPSPPPPASNTPPPPPPASIYAPEPAPPGTPPLPRRSTARVRISTDRNAAIAITESAARVHEPVPSRRKWWLAAWLLLGLIAAVIIAYALSRNTNLEGSVPPEGMTQSSVVAEEDVTDDAPLTDTEPDTPPTTEPQASVDEDPVEPTAEETEEVVADIVSDSPIVRQVTDPDFEPSTSINPPVILDEVAE